MKRPPPQTSRSVERPLVPPILVGALRGVGAVRGRPVDRRLWQGLHPCRRPQLKPFRFRIRPTR